MLALGFSSSSRFFLVPWGVSTVFPYWNGENWIGFPITEIASTDRVTQFKSWSTRWVMKSREKTYKSFPPWPIFRRQKSLKNWKDVTAATSVGLLPHHVHRYTLSQRFDRQIEAHSIEPPGASSLGCCKYTIYHHPTNQPPSLLLQQ